MNHREIHYTCEIEEFTLNTDEINLLNKIKNVVGYKGEIEFNSDKPEGQYLRKMNLDQMRKLNLKTKTSLDEGIRRTYSFYVENEEFLR